MSWKVTEACTAFLDDVMTEFRERGMGKFPIYPSVMWSPGGAAWKASDPSGTRVEQGPGYAVGFYKRNPAPEGGGLVLVANERFGMVVFLPNESDRVSARRLIDYDGKGIVVR